jgi:hypothetical protein
MTPFVTMRRALSDRHLLGAALGGDSWLACRVGGDVAIPTPQSGRIEARTGLRMMPTFPRPSLSFRKAGFPGTAGRMAYQTVPSRDVTPLKSAPDIRCMTPSLHPPFVHFVVAAILPLRVRSADSMMHRHGGWVVLHPRGPRSSPGYSVPVRHHLIGPIRPLRHPALRSNTI